MSKKKPSYDLPAELPVVALRDLVIFPEIMQSVPFSRELSTKAIDAVLENGGTNIVAVCQKDKDKESPLTEEDIFKVGVLCQIVNVSRRGGEYSVDIRGLCRVNILNLVQEDPYLLACVDAVKEVQPVDQSSMDDKFTALKTQVREMADASPTQTEHLIMFIDGVKDPGTLIDVAVSHMSISPAEKQELLEEANIEKRLDKCLELSIKEIEIQGLKTDVAKNLREKFDTEQRKMFIREQIKALRSELGESDEEEDLEALQAKIEDTGMPEDVMKVAEKEMARLRRTHAASSEWSVIRNYIDWLIDVPWKDETEDNLNINEVKAKLEEHHYGLEDVKKRIIEFISVRKLRKDNKSPILCFVGAPGVGKTSLAKSIAEALGRKCERISLGGVRDESEIRGHRRTYVGALPGRVISAMKRVNVINPVIIFDEIDKVGDDYRGDPSSALLEVLDPEQNCEFNDHYMEIPYDLSKVLFICTANEVGTIKPALRDRMEIIELSGYTQEEKLQIAKRHLVDLEKENSGLTDFRVTDEALSTIISRYTREAGVRILGQTIAKCARKIATRVASDKPVSPLVSAKSLKRYLGVPKFDSSLHEEDNPSGVVTGLAWSKVGGDILFIESTRMPQGKGNVKITGLPGDSMKESAEAALSYLRSNQKKYGIESVNFDKEDVHIHFPEGGIPKDGPSAGIALVTSLTSLYRGQPITGDIAMTGEISLRGKVLPIGGLKEKLLAAIRAGVKTVFVPKQNEHDISEMSKDITSKLNIILVSRIDEVLGRLFAPAKFEEEEGIDGCFPLSVNNAAIESNGSY